MQTGTLGFLSRLAGYPEGCPGLPRTTRGAGQGIPAVAPEEPAKTQRSTF